MSQSTRGEAEAGAGIRISIKNQRVSRFLVIYVTCVYRRCKVSLDNQSTSVFPDIALARFFYRAICLIQGDCPESSWILLIRDCDTAQNL